MTKLQQRAAAQSTDLAHMPAMTDAQHSLNAAFETQVLQARRAQAAMLDAVQSSMDRWLERRRARAAAANDTITAIFNSNAPREAAAAWSHWCGETLRTATEDYYDQLMMGAKTARSMIHGLSDGAASEPALLERPKDPAKPETAD